MILDIERMTYKWWINSIQAIIYIVLATIFNKDNKEVPIKVHRIEVSAQEIASLLCFEARASLWTKANHAWYAKTINLSSN